MSAGAGSRTGWAKCLLAVPLALAAADLAAQARRADPPVRQPMLIRPIPPSELVRPEARRPAPSAPTHRPGSPMAGEDLFLDREGPAHGRLQKPHEALAGFPLDRGGFVDWSAALAEGRISPRAALGGGAAPVPHDLDVILRRTREMPYVRFSHRAHAAWLGCGSCHPAPFAAKAGESVTTMESIFRGQSCGMCHGKVAFPAWHACERCHSVARPGGRAADGGGAPTSR
ncbi:MAG: hypothetical protein KF738_12080 [Burkholderiales bacterium]|nr:hypothetical protein [Burkholderiales bacterium]